MREALNGFVIRGISSNIPFQAALLAHPKFVAGRLQHRLHRRAVPEGFSPGDMVHDDPDLSCWRWPWRRTGASASAPRHQRPAARATAPDRRGPWWWLTDAGAGTSAPGTITAFDGAAARADAAPAGTSRSISFDNPLATSPCTAPDGRPFRVQVERVGLDYAHRVARRQHRLARVLSPRAAELLRLMPFKAPPDLSKVPAVADARPAGRRGGQPARRCGRREAGRDRGDEDGEHPVRHPGLRGEAEVAAKTGESLAVDQVIIRFQ
jgi:propionyl-CoA carboxylase alpha chain